MYISSRFVFSKSCVEKKKMESALPLEGVLMGTAQCSFHLLLAYIGINADTKTKPISIWCGISFLIYTVMQILAFVHVRLYRSQTASIKLLLFFLKSAALLTVTLINDKQKSI